MDDILNKLAKASTPEEVESVLGDSGYELVEAKGEAPEEKAEGEMPPSGASGSEPSEDEKAPPFGKKKMRDIVEGTMKEWPNA